MNQYYITKNGVPCKLDKSIKLHHKGLLRECEPGEQHISGIGYNGKKKMQRAIDRTTAAARKMSGCVFSEWSLITWLTRPA